MATLYLDRQDMDIRHEGKYWCLYAEGQRQGTVPLNLVERVVVTRRATLMRVGQRRCPGQGDGIAQTPAKLAQKA